jgi:hypothetical protein
VTIVEASVTNGRLSRHWGVPMLLLPASFMVLALVATPSAAVPPELTQKVLERARSRGLSEETAASLVAAMARAESGGLPAESVGDKVLEGVAKGADPARILEASNDLTRRLGLARQAFAEAGVKLEPRDRRASLERLAATISGAPETVLALAQAAKGTDAPSLVAAARQLGELRSRGVEPTESLAALASLAREGRTAEIARVAALLDEYVAEGGRDHRGFLQEVKNRAEQRRSLDDVVDPFGLHPDPLNRSDSGRGKAPAAAQEKPANANSSGQPLLEKENRAGSAPGLDRDSAGRMSKDCLNGKGKGRPDCR